jgi:hypothetical protein
VPTYELIIQFVTESQKIIGIFEHGRRKDDKVRTGVTET